MKISKHFMFLVLIHIGQVANSYHAKVACVFIEVFLYISDEILHFCKGLFSFLCVNGQYRFKKSGCKVL